ncbi:hypothetical protein D9613_003496 [Agrocybe pediades]|uniref:N-acetyltransferase domain-containing protein n=1 Tax=Agrocybe pediades TaxID=84607 RepID=A0A8H4VLB9_9AGAR|nr:hypothetical protein D9613_003496 [Agrocybe pediades]
MNEKPTVLPSEPNEPAPPINAAQSEDYEEKLTIHVRPYRNSDLEAVRDLFYDSMSGEGSPYYFAMRAQWTRPISLVTYACALIGMMLIVRSGQPLMRKAGYGIVFISVLVFSAYRYSLRATFEDFLKRNLEGDFAHIPDTYDIEVVPLEEYRSKPLGSDSAFKGRNGFWVAETPSGDVVGCLGLDSNTHNSNETTSELRHLVVSRKFRRRGIAQQLVTAAVEHAKELGTKTLFLTTSSYQRAALGLYQKLGWTKQEIRRVSVLFDNIDIYALQLDLENYHGWNC